MIPLYSIFALYCAAGVIFCAALLHFACLFLGAASYRFLGAGDAIVEMAKKGHWYPHFTAIVVGTVLTVIAAYAFFAAQGNLLPFTKLILSLVTAVFLLRSMAFPILKSRFKGNSDLFWYTSSGICLIFGLLLAIGIIGL